MITLDELRQLIAVEDYGTLSAAAEELHISQPSLTRTMKHLEDELQVSLFDRRKNRLHPNATGKLMMEKSRALLSQMDSMIASVQAYDRQQRTIIIGSIAPLPMWALQQAIAEAFPEKTIATELKSADQLLIDLRRGADHLVILPAPVNNERIVSFRLFDEQLYFSLPRQHPKAEEPELSFSDMDGAMFLLSSNIGFWHDIHEKKMPHTRFLLQNEYETLRELVQASTLPSFTSNQVMMRDSNLPKDRVAIPISDPEAKVTYYAVCMKERWKLFERCIRNTQQ